VTLVVWIAAASFTFMGFGAFLNSNPNLKVHAGAVVICVSIAVLRRRAPLVAEVALLVFSYAVIYVVTTNTGTGIGAVLLDGCRACLRAARHRAHRACGASWRAGGRAPSRWGVESHVRLPFSEHSSWSRERVPARMPSGFAP
jgi:hypothetical protein